MIYKTLKKVSDVCQLVDKSKYSSTNTVNGITFTNNKDDGTITVNGTATNRAVNTYVIYTKTRLSGKVLLTGCPSGGSSNTYYNYVYIRNSNYVWITGNNEYGNGCFLNYGVTAYNILCQIIIEKGTVCDNLIFKPQLFDLTEMYGAGNEPTTVEEFRTKFPNELYDYKPYCFVKSYKNCLKVNEYCQLLDKSKFPATQTVNGVTFTNNGDGTITANGTATSRAVFLIEKEMPVIYGKGLISGDPEVRSAFINYVYYSAHSWICDNASYAGKGTIFAERDDAVYGKLYIAVEAGTIANNLVFKPQLFDLTEMYGAGNEPTTVEEFRQDFPEELYDYKPYSIVPSYKKSLVCKTKNLLPYPYYETTITRNGVTFTDNRDGTITANGTSIGFATFVFSNNFNFIAGNKYYVSTPYSIIAYKENGTIYYIQGDKSFTWSSNWEVVQIYMQINKGITLNNLKIYPMINLGDTATEYHPYGYL